MSATINGNKLKNKLRASANAPARNNPFCFKSFIENRFKIVIFLPWCRDPVLRAHFLSCSVHVLSFSCILTWHADDIGLSSPSKSRSSSFLSFWRILELNVAFLLLLINFLSVSCQFLLIFLSRCFHFLFGYSFAIFSIFGVLEILF